MNLLHAHLRVYTSSEQLPYSGARGVVVGPDAARGIYVPMHALRGAGLSPAGFGPRRARAVKVPAAAAAFLL